MMNPVLHLFTNIGRLAAAVVISFLFFVGISMLHAMIDLGQTKETETKKNQQVLMEMVRKPPPEQPKKSVQQVRQVKDASDENKSLENQTAMKFVPDLSLDAGAGGDGGGAEIMVRQSQDLQAEVFEEGETDERPIPITTTPIEYPLEARERNIEGTLVVYFIIGHDGKVKSIDVQKSPSPIITREAKKTISSWRFKPGKKSGVPVNVRAKKEVVFELQKK